MNVPRRPKWPLSGGDRKSLAKAIALADSAYDAFKAKTDAARRQYARLACETWNAQIFQGGPLHPSPTIGLAIEGDCSLIEIQCKRCETARFVDLTKIRRPRNTRLEYLDDATLDCSYCGPHRWKPRGRILSLRSATVEPDPETQKRPAIP